MLISLSNLVAKHNLTFEQVAQFEQYALLLKEWNELFNLTAILEIDAICSFHFDDSLTLGMFHDLNVIKGLADIGSGGGFPGIPLKIKYPHLFVVLVEVNGKKRLFLEAVIEKLGLKNIEVSSYDWRTFLRKTDFSVDIICARASLQPEELIRMFTFSSSYKDAMLVYWASGGWIAENKVRSYILKETCYNIENKSRKLVFFSSKNR